MALRAAHHPQTPAWAAVDEIVHRCQYSSNLSGQLGPAETWLNCDDLHDEPDVSAVSESPLDGGDISPDEARTTLTGPKTMGDGLAKPPTVTPTC